VSRLQFGNALWAFLKRQPLGLMLDGTKLELRTAKPFTVELRLRHVGCMPSH
jgi:hypothetical protein